MTTCTCSRRRNITRTSWLNFELSARMITSRAFAATCRLTGTSSTLDCVKPSCMLIPFAPRKALVKWNCRTASSVRCPRRECDGACTLPPRTSVSMLALRSRAWRTLVECVTTVMRRVSSMARARSAVVLPASMKIDSPGCTRAHAARAMASFSARWTVSRTR